VFCNDRERTRLDSSRLFSVLGGGGGERVDEIKFKGEDILWLGAGVGSNSVVAAQKKSKI
jgi:hypothetical protein